MIHWPIIQAVKITLSGKIGACLTIAAPIMLAVEMKNHVDTIITSATTIVIFIGGIIFLKKGQDRIYISMDGRMKELLETTKKIAHQAGKDEMLDETRASDKLAAHAAGKEQERGEARERLKEDNKEVKVMTEVIIANPEDNPANVKTVKKL